MAGGLALDNRQDQSGTTAHVVAIGSGCSGLSVSTVIRGETKQLGCVDVPASPPAGAVALSVVADQGWLVVDKDTWRSRDGLRTWTRAGLFFAGKGNSAQESQAPSNARGTTAIPSGRR